ncbi:MAG: Crp/Fnr family transcriptional regulator [Alphaproteobacteria bacterium]|nr:Crp/Fnr family transcriptional regulator [Alphaproteobacteria bacterium]
MARSRKDIHNSDIPNLCRACEARHRGICGALSAEQLIELNKRASRRKHELGATLVRDAEPVTRYSNIISGVVKLSKLLADGRQQIVGLQFAPDFLGRPLRTDSQTAAEAATDVELCSFPRVVLERLMDETPDLERKLFEQSLKELDEAREWMVTLGRKTAPEKVANFLYMTALHSNPEAELGDGALVQFDLPLTRSEIADFLGLTIETVSRQLTSLRKAGIIDKVNKRGISIADMRKLKNLSGL